MVSSQSDLRASKMLINHSLSASARQSIHKNHIPGHYLTRGILNIPYLCCLTMPCCGSCHCKCCNEEMMDLLIREVQSHRCLQVGLPVLGMLKSWSEWGLQQIISSYREYVFLIGHGLRHKSIECKSDFVFMGPLSSFCEQFILRGLLFLRGLLWDQIIR